MSALYQQPSTIDGFLAWEAGQALRHEFDGAGPVAMTGGTIAHALVQSGLIRVLGTTLAGSAGRVVGPDIKLRTGAGTIRYPDAMVYCTALPPGETVIADPLVVIEILSDSTAKTDRGAKNRDYAATPSIRRYIMLEQDEIGGLMFERVGTDWIGHILAAGTILPMPELGIEVPLREIYADIALP